MTHSNGSQLPRRLCRRLTATALVLLAALGSSRVCVADSAISGADAALRFGGQVNALVIDPHIPTTLYAASECFGVLENVDGGESWHAASTGLPGLVKKLAVDPTATPTTLYAGTQYGGPALSGGGVFKSADGAGTWSAAGLADTGIFALVIDRENANTLYAAAYYNGQDGIDRGGGVFKSTDGAGTWNAVSTGLTNPNVRDLAIDPETPNTIYVATAGGESAARTCPLGADLDHTFS